MKNAVDIAQELDLIHSHLSKPTGTEDFLLLIGQALASILKELQDLNTKADQLLHRMQ